jgi:uncharacterized protein (TIGR02118 family)
MLKLLILYKTQPDPEAFRSYYREHHTPLVHKIPGLLRFEVSHGPINTPDGPSDIELIAALYFKDLPSFTAGVSGPEGEAATADVANFVSDMSTVSRFIFETQDR